MPKERPKTRGERKKKQKDNYTAGKSSKAYVHTPALCNSLVEGNSGPSTASEGSVNSKVCDQCKPVLPRYQDHFKSIVHQGSQLKRCKSTNPYPKKNGQAALQRSRCAK